MSSTRTKTRSSMRVRALAASTAALTVLLVSAPLAAHAAAAFDDFDRPDGSLGASWTTVSGVTSLVGGRATGTDHSAALLNGAAGTRVSVDAYAGSGISFVALIAGYTSASAAYFVKLQDNDGNGSFDSVYAYYGDTAGSAVGTWSAPATSHARIALTMSGSNGTFTVDSDLDGDVDASYTMTFPAAASPGVGLGFYGQARADGFAVDAVPVAVTAAAATTVTVGSGTLEVVADAGGTPAAGTIVLEIPGEAARSAVLDDGVADFDLGALPVGAHTFTARYAPALGYEPAPAATGTITVNAIATTTSLAAPTSTMAVGATTSFSATVTAASGTAVGDVSFYDGADLVGTSPLVGGIATFGFGSAEVGSHSITAVYAGSATHATSTSGAFAITVDPATTTTTLVLDAASVEVGTEVRATATVAAAGVGVAGDVEFFAGSTSLGAAVLTAGSAELAFTPSVSGVLQITARYAGATITEASTSVASVLTVSGHPATVTIATGALRERAPTVLRATVTSTGTPTGSVEFFADGTSLGSAPIVAGVAELSGVTLPAGAVSLRALYSGSSSVVAADAVLGVEVARAPVLGSTGADLAALSAGVLLFLAGGALLVIRTARRRRTQEGAASLR